MRENTPKKFSHIIILGTALSLTACSGMRPDTLGAQNGKLAPCPDKPNCVSSFADTEDHSIKPFTLAPETNNAEAATAAMKEALNSLPRTQVVQEDAGYLHAESTSMLMRYVDDVEILVDAENGVTHVKSASRVGYSDLGVNRDRVETLRQYLLEKQKITE